MTRLEELQRKRLKRQKRSRVAKYLASTGIIVLTGVNVLFGVINLKAPELQAENRELLRAQAMEALASEEETEAAPTTTAPAETEPVESETEETTAAPTLSAYEMDARYEVVSQFDTLGFLMPPGSIFAEIYEEPTTEARVIGKGRIYSGVNILSATEFFYEVEYEGCTGYILKTCIKVGEEAEALALEYAHSFCHAIEEGEPIYSQPNEQSEALFYCSKEKKLGILDEMGDWCKVYTETGVEGYMRAERVEKWRFLDDSYFFQKPGEHISDKRLEILSYAFNFFGGKYVWGGESLKDGVDCSAYVMRIYEHFNIPMPRLSAEQAEWGEKVASMDEILPGDLLFYHGYNDAVEEVTEGVGHVGIYIGNGKMIHAASTSRGIVVDDYDYVEKPLRIRRVITDD